MLTAPLKWLIRAIAELPDAVRPGLFVALIFMAVWFVVGRQGIRGFWHATCRGAARAVDFVVSLALLPEYTVTTARRRRGEPPGRGAALLAGPTAVALGSAATLYERHESGDEKTRKLPMKIALLIMVAGVVAWLMMTALPSGDRVKRELARAYEHYRDVEAWADVAPRRRAAAGDDGIFDVGDISRDRLTVYVPLSCPGEARCAGVLVARNRYGTQMASTPVELQSGERTTVQLMLTTVSRGYVRDLHANVEQK